MDWIRGHVIGHGASAAVSTATLRPSGETIAVKSAELSRSVPLLREHEILSNLSHPHIIGHVGCDISLENNKPIFNLMIEYAPGGTLADAVRRLRLDEEAIARYASGIAAGLEYLHSRGVVHCDIKGSNVLLSRGGEAKIADFGCAKAADEAAIGGTPMYMAPEVARGEEQRFPADIWALGCTVIEMSTGESPWPNTMTTLRRIAFSGETPRVPIHLSDSAKDFLSKCLRVDPEERWTAGELLEHPFLDELRFGGDSKEIEGNTCSPTSVLDQGIWGSIEDEFAEGVSDVDDGGDFVNGAVERMKGLIVSCSGNRGNWEWGERWITVRDGETVNISFNSGGKFREEGVAVGRSSYLERDTEELVLDQFQFL